MSSFVLGGAIGFLAASVLAAGSWFGFGKRLCPDRSAHELTDQDRDDLAVEFAVHTSAARQSVSDYADRLADGDPALRERLRQFETGGE